MRLTHKCPVRIVASVLFLVTVAAGIVGLPSSQCLGEQPGKEPPSEKKFRWPKGQQCAVSLTYDDSIPIHYQKVGPQLEKHGLKATFYLPIVFDVRHHPQEWRKLAARGHELGNHSLFHPCRRIDIHKTWLPDEYDLMKYTPRRFTEELQVANLVLHLLGGKQHERIQAYASSLFGRDGRETKAIAQRWRSEGYQAIKFGWEPMGQNKALDIDLVRGAREGIGDGTLLIDAGCVWDARTALRRAHAFQEFNVEWLEEPLRPDDVDGYRWLRDRSPLPIAAGEQECGRESWRALIDGRALDVYQVDLARNGFTDANYIKQRVQEVGARLCNHCFTSPVTLAAGLHWLSTCRDAFLFEDCVEDSPLRHELTHEKIQAEGGWVEVPDRPGLGVTLDDDFIAKYLVADSGRNLKHASNGEGGQFLVPNGTRENVATQSEVVR